MTRTAVIINPNAGQQKILKHIDHISNLLTQSFEEVHFYKTKRSGDTSKVIPKIAAKHDLIIIAGGDGTVYEAINGLAPLDNRPTIAVIPGGTCNDFSRAIGMDQDPIRATEQIISQKQQKIDVGQTNHQYFLNFWGIGLITKVSANINPHVKQLFGRLSYYLSTLQQINASDPFKYEINTLENHYQGYADMILVSSGPFTGGVKPFFPDATIQDGFFDVLILKEASLQSIVNIVKADPQDSNSFLEDDAIISFKTSELSIQTDPVQTIDCDGERHVTTPDHLKILKGYLDVMVGDLSKV